MCNFQTHFHEVSLVKLHNCEYDWRSLPIGHYSFWWGYTSPKLVVTYWPQVPSATSHYLNPYILGCMMICGITKSKSINVIPKLDCIQDYTCDTNPLKSLAPGRCGCTLNCVIFKHILWINILNTSHEIVLRWMRKHHSLITSLHWFM